MRTLLFQLFLLLAIGMFFKANGQGCAPLNGTYTVGNPNSDFPYVDTALARLSRCGVSGPVLLQFSGGRQSVTEPLLAIPGASAVNTIHFKGRGMYQDTLTTDSNAAIILDIRAADYVTISDLTFFLWNGWRCISLRNQVEHLSIERCHFRILNTNFGNHGAIFASADPGGVLSRWGHHGNTFRHLTIRNCNFLGGHYGINLLGTKPPTGPSSNAHLTIEDNRLEDVQLGIYLDELDSLILQNNVVHAKQTAVSIEYIHTGWIRANQLYGDYQGFLLQRSGSPNFSKSLQVHNNAMSSLGVFGFGADIGDVRSLDFLHNSVLCKRNAVELSSLSNATIENNIFESREDFALQVVNGNSWQNVSLDYNLYFTTLFQPLVLWDGTTYGTLSDFKSGQPTYNQHAVSGNPELPSFLNMAGKSLTANNAANPLTALNVDLLGQTRPLNSGETADLGAYEYDILHRDVAVREILAPDLSCASANGRIGVVIQNAGMLGLDSIRIRLKTIGGANQSLQYLHLQHLPPSGTDTLYIGGINTLPLVVSMHLAVKAELRGDQNSSNDSLYLLAGKYYNAQPDYFPIKPACANKDSVRVEGIPFPNMQLQWFKDSSLTQLHSEKHALTLYTRNQLKWYLRHKPVERSLTTDGTSAQNTHLGGGFVNLEGFNNLSIKSLRLDLDGSTGANVPVKLFLHRNGSYYGKEEDPTYWTLFDSVSVVLNAGSGLYTIQLNQDLSLETGEQVALYIQAPLRSSPVPYGFNTYNKKNKDLRLNAGSMLQTAFSGLSRQQFFYSHWEYVLTPCPSPPTVVPLPISSDSVIARFVYRTLSMNPYTVEFEADTTNATGFEWFFHDGSKQTGFRVTKIYPMPGDYTVSLHAQNASCRGKDFRYSLIRPNLSTSENRMTSGFDLYPNPAQDHITIRMPYFQASVPIEIFTMQGQVVLSQHILANPDEPEHKLNIQSLARGIYWVKVGDGEQVYMHRLVVN